MMPQPRGHMENTTETASSIEKLDQKQNAAIKKAILWAKNKMETTEWYMEQLNDVQLSVNVLQFIYRGRVFELRKENDERTQEQITHDSNKAARLGVAFAHYVLSNAGQIKFKIHEIEQAKFAVKVLEAIAKDFQAKIEAVEPPPPPKEAEEKKPYVMEVPVKADLQAVQ